jgi:predicted dinucleotide-binding enzyme
LTTVTLSDTTVAIIGTGNIGSRLAANFAAGGQHMLLAGRDQENTRKIASTLDGHAQAVSVDEAIERGDVLGLAVWFDTSKQLIAEHGQRLAGTWAVWTSPFALRSSATCTNSEPWVGS